VSRLSLAAIAALLVAGLAAPNADWSVQALAAACAVLVAVPVVNVLAVFAEEVRARDWPFVAVAGAVLVLLAYSMSSKLW